MANYAPGSVEMMLLLPDGTVMAEDFNGTSWYKLTPDIQGSYVNGTWSARASAHYSRTWCSSQVLQDGRVFFAGGEYGNGTTNAEVYSTTNDSWTIIPVPAGLINMNNTVDPVQGNNTAGFIDSGSKLLANGNVLIFPVVPANCGETVIFSPFSNTLFRGPNLLRGCNEDEASCVKLPDGSLLNVDSGATAASRYIPASNSFINDNSSPVALYDPYGTELGPAFLLPNGKAIFFGSTGHTAIYTPSGSTTPGTWVAGPDFPNGQGMPDAPGAMMVDGKILLATSPVPTSGNHFPTPTSFYEYDYTNGPVGSFTQVSAPGGFITSNPPFQGKMLVLPNGQVLFTAFLSNQLWVYTPGGAPLLAGKPTIATIGTNGDGTLHLTGTLFNGISEGACYGDDAQMDSNYPLVRFTDVSGNVRYGRTYGWSSTGVATGSATVSTECALPAGASISDVIQVVANGNASDGVSRVVLNTADSGLGSLRQVVNISAAGSVVTFVAGLSGQTITLTSGEIPLANNVTIDGSALPNGIRIDGNHSSRIFNVAGGGNVTLNALVLTNGYTTNGNWGGAIFNAGTLALNDCTLAGNAGDSTVNGGAVANQGPLTVTGCTFSGNSAGFSGAIDNRSTCTLQNSTFYGNTAFAGNGGAIDNPFSATLSVLHCTFSANSASSLGGAIDNYLSQLSITNSILSGNTGQDIYNWSGSTIDSGGTNIIPALGNAGTLVGGGTILVVDPLLGPLANNGGPTLTMLPQTGSPAIDAGVTSLAAGLAYDQRGPGYPRLVGEAVDIGAVEAGVVPFVFNTADAHYGSLRYAVSYTTNNATITFANNLAGQAIVLTSGAITLNQNVTINAAPLAGGIQVNGNHASRAFNVGRGVAAVLDSLTITNGLAAPGGGIYSFGLLTLNDCKLVGNQSPGTSGGGALIALLGGATTLNGTTVAGNLCENVSGLYIKDGPLTLRDCTISGNSGAKGDAIRLLAANAYTLMSAVNSTISGNTTTAAAGVGSALSMGSSAAMPAAAFLTNCTVASNTVTGAGQPGAIYVYSGGAPATLGLYNTIVSGNTSGGVPGDITGTADPSSAYNLVGAGGGLVNGVNGNIVGINDPQLAPLGDYGGETQTMPPLPGSPVVDAGSDAIATAAGLTTDQRGPGYPRVVGSAVDVGAVEYDAPVIITSPSNVTFLAGLSNSFTVTATGALAPTISVAGSFPPGVSFTPPATLSGTPPDGSGGAWPLTVTASNGISPNAIQDLTLNVVERSVFAAHPNFHTNGLGWALNGDTVNGGPVINNNLFTLTDGSSGENRSGWFRYPLYVGAFEASFTYQDIGGGGADGVGFVIQNDPRGTTALGLGGGALAYADITSSVAVLLNIYSGALGGPSGLMLGTNGVDAYDGSGVLSGKSYQSTAPVNLDGGNPIAVALRYTGGILQVTLTDTVTSDNFQTDIPVNVLAFTGTNVAWVGITGSEGGVLSHQTVSDFSYVPLPVLLSGPGSGNSVNLSWPASIYGYHLQTTSNLLGNVWADLPVTVTQTNGLNLATVPATGNSQFFRLVLPPH